MHFSFFIITASVVLSLVITTLCLWLSLKIFKLKPERRNSLFKIIGLEAVFIILTGLIGSITGGGVSTLFSLLCLFGSVYLWVSLLKRFAPANYSPGRAIASYFASYILAFISAIIVATLAIIIFAQVFEIDGNSMAPAYKADQKVLVYKFDKHPENGNVVVYINKETGKQALGRVSGKPGELVKMTAGPDISAIKQIKLSANEYYVTTDNTSYGIPDRVIKADNIVGVVGPKL